MEPSPESSTRWSGRSRIEASAPEKALPQRPVAVAEDAELDHDLLSELHVTQPARGDQAPIADRGLVDVLRSLPMRTNSSSACCIGS